MKDYDYAHELNRSPYYYTSFGQRRNIKQPIKRIVYKRKKK